MNIKKKMSRLLWEQRVKSLSNTFRHGEAYGALTGRYGEQGREA